MMVNRRSFSQRVSLACRIATVSIAAVIVGGCESTPALFKRITGTVAEEVADVFVSAYPAIQWADIAEKLEPKHAITTEQARALAAQTTQVQVFQFLSTFAAGLGIGLPGRIDTATTTLAADGTQTTTASRTRGTGTPPTSSGMPSAAIAESALGPDLSKGPLALGVDANTALTAGTAVYQLGQILDNQITKGLIPPNYQVHLVTLQINLQPKSRTSAYDAYVNVSLMPGTWQQALAATETDKDALIDELPPVIVYPLVITDALETTSTGRSIEVMRQAALQLLGVIGAVGVNAGVSGGSDRLESVIGSDKNSLVTLGRVSDHSVRIRLGAQNSGSSGFAMVPRTHNVSLVVLTRWDETKPSKRVTSLSAITHTSLAPSDGGGPLRSGRERSDLAEQVRGAVKDFVFGPVPPTCSALVDAKGEPIYRGELNDEQLKAEIEISKYLDLLRAVDRADYAYVKKCLALPDKLDVQREVTLRRLLAQLIQIQTSSRYSKVSIPLKGYPDATLPDGGQFAVLMDDGKSSSTFVLRGGKGLRPERLAAELKLKEAPKPAATPVAGKAPKQKPQKPSQKPAAQKPVVQNPPAAEQAPPKDIPYKLLHTAVKVVGGGSEVQVTFPSLQALGVQVGDGKPLTISYEKVGQFPVVYAVRATKPQPTAAPNPVRATSAVLVIDGNGLARVTLQVGEMPKDPFVAPMRLVVTGADVREDKAINAPGLTSKGVPIAPESTITLSLGNITLSRPVSIATVDKNNKPIGESIVLGVDRAVPASR